MNQIIILLAANEYFAVVDETCFLKTLYEIMFFLLTQLLPGSCGFRERFQTREECIAFTGLR